MIVYVIKVLYLGLSFLSIAVARSRYLTLHVLMYVDNRCILPLTCSLLENLVIWLFQWIVSYVARDL